MTKKNPLNLLEDLFKISAGQISELTKTQISTLKSFSESQIKQLKNFSKVQIKQLLELKKVHRDLFFNLKKKNQKSLFKYSKKDKTPLSEILQHLINLKKYSDTRYISHDLRVEVYEKDNGKCQLTGNHIPFTSYEPDHIIPYSKKQETDIDNLQVLCGHHNRVRQNKDWNKFKNTYPRPYDNCRKAK